MRTETFATVILLAAVGLASAETVSQRWGGKDSSSTHPDTLKVVSSEKGVKLTFDLSALPKEAKSYHASLDLATAEGRQPTNPAKVLRAGDDGPVGKPFALEAPYYRSFDVTDALAAGSRSVGFIVELDGIVPERSTLEICYEGAASDVPEQVSGLKAVHHDGQTFLVWKELKEFQPPAGSVLYVSKFSRRGNEVAKEPGSGFRDLPRVPAITLKTLRDMQGLELRDKPSGFQGIKQARQVRKVADLRYRIYRHTERITSKNIHQAELVGVAAPLSAYDQKMAVISFKGEYIDQREVGDSIIPTSCVEDGKPVAAGEAVFVHNVAKPGRAYYAVTSVLGGTENLADVSDANSTADAVVEKTDPPKPVLQRIQEIQYGKGVIEKWYLFWAGPPYANLPDRPLHVLVGEPEDVAPPLPMIVDGFHGGFNIVGALRVPAGKAMTLLIEHQAGYGGDGDLLYNEGLGTLKSYAECKVDYFSERYFLRIIDWARKGWQIDPGRITGGQHDSGPLHIGIRHPEIFGAVFLGNYTASYVYDWAPPSRGLAAIMGPEKLARTPAGEPAWDVLDLMWYCAQDPGKDAPLIWGGSNVGKDSGHTSEFGWQDDPRGYKALLLARQPLALSWGLNLADPSGSQGYRGMAPELAALIASRRWDRTVPAFSNCSLDNNPGNGDPADGDACGQINGYLVWSDEDSVDKPDRWEMTVWLASTCPADQCTVDVTPRHTKAFKPKPGQKFTWTVSPLRKEGVGVESQSGAVEADKWGRVTLKGVEVGKGKLRIVIEMAK